MFETMFLGLSLFTWIVIAVLGFPMLLVLMNSVHFIGPTEIGLVKKNISSKSLNDGNPIAFNGEAGYQADMLMPGLRLKLWPIYSVDRMPWVQVPAGQIGVVIAQFGKPLPPGAKSARYKSEFQDFRDLKTFLEKDGQKGVQRPVLPPGSTVPLHPIAFLVLTRDKVYGIPVLEEYAEKASKGTLSISDFGLQPNQLQVTRIRPEEEDGKVVDYCGVITTYEGDPLSPGEIASRIGGFQDVSRMEQGLPPEPPKKDGEDQEQSTDDAPTEPPQDGEKSDEQSPTQPSNSEMIERLVGTKNQVHNNYQDFQAFLDAGGRIGLQHDTLLYGAYLLNPFLVSVEKVPMLVVRQGEVAVIKAFVGLPTKDTSGEGFKFGSIVKPGHRGIWEEPLRTGKYAINPRCYSAEIMPTAILTLNWAESVTSAHELDAKLCPIEAKSNEGFVFRIDLQVQIHVPDTQAPKVISMVGSMRVLVNEVLQAAVGNHFRDKLQSMPAVKFIDSRAEVQEEAMAHISERLQQYDVETRGVYIQDVIFPTELVQVLTEREIANQQVKTFQQQKLAQDQRVTMEKAKGQADQQAELARSEVGVSIKENDANARKAEGDGEATYIQRTGEAAGAKIKSVGLARAEAYREQVSALGQSGTMVVNVAEAFAGAGTSIMPEVLVAGGGGGSLEALAASLTRSLGPGAFQATGSAAAPKDEVPAVPVPPVGDDEPEDALEDEIGSEA